MEIYIAILISAAVFCAGLAIGSVITLQIQKRLKKKEEESTETEEEPKPEEKPAEPEIPADVQLLTEIRDLLKQQPTSEKK